MTFPYALSEVFDNNARITRRTWSNPVIFVSVVNLQLCITGGNPTDGKDLDKPHPWVVTESDYFADDWEVIE